MGIKKVHSRGTEVQKDAQKTAATLFQLCKRAF